MHGSIDHGPECFEYFALAGNCKVVPETGSDIGDEIGFGAAVVCYACLVVGGIPSTIRALSVGQPL